MQKLDTANRQFLETQFVKATNDLHLAREKYKTVKGAQRLKVGREIQTLQKRLNESKYKLNQLDQQDAKTVANRSQTGLQRALR